MDVEEILNMTDKERKTTMDKLIDDSMVELRTQDFVADSGELVWLKEDKPNHYILYVGNRAVTAYGSQPEAYKGINELTSFLEVLER